MDQQTSLLSPRKVLEENYSFDSCCDTFEGERVAPNPERVSVGAMASEASP